VVQLHQLIEEYKATAEDLPWW